MLKVVTESRTHIEGERGVTEMSIRAEGVMFFFETGPDWLLPWHRIMLVEFHDRNLED